MPKCLKHRNAGCPHCRIDELASEIEKLKASALAEKKPKISVVTTWTRTSGDIVEIQCQRCKEWTDDARGLPALCPKCREWAKIGAEAIAAYHDGTLQVFCHICEKYHPVGTSHECGGEG